MFISIYSKFDNITDIRIEMTLNSASLIKNTLYIDSQICIVGLWFFQAAGEVALDLGLGHKLRLAGREAFAQVRISRGRQTS